MKLLAKIKQSRWHDQIYLTVILLLLLGIAYLVTGTLNNDFCFLSMIFAGLWLINGIYELLFNQNRR